MDVVALLADIDKPKPKREMKHPHWDNLRRQMAVCPYVRGQQALDVEGQIPEPLQCFPLYADQALPLVCLHPDKPGKVMVIGYGKKYGEGSVPTFAGDTSRVGLFHIDPSARGKVMKGEIVRFTEAKQEPWTRQTLRRLLAELGG